MKWPWRRDKPTFNAHELVAAPQEEEVGAGYYYYCVRCNMAISTFYPLDHRAWTPSGQEAHGFGSCPNPAREPVPAGAPRGDGKEGVSSNETNAVSNV